MSARIQVKSSCHLASRATNSNRCTFTTSDNRRCTMLRHNFHHSLCLFHARKEHLLLQAEATRRELAALSELHSSTDVNHGLTRLWALLIDGRITNKRAASLAHWADKER